ncbi:hypothetical protein GCM10010317_099810 [Streptomyces mirabilis]|nr:hypothetical protein GCM10010317_099810 [Streptomyces mirabilis]
MKVNGIVDTFFGGDIRSRASDRGARHARVTRQRPAPAPGRERFVVLAPGFPSPHFSEFLRGTPGVEAREETHPRDCGAERLGAFSGGAR